MPVHCNCMRFFLRWKTAPGRPSRGAPELEKTKAERAECEGADFGGKLLDLFENMICTFARRCDPAGDQARRALRLLGPGGNQKQAAQMLQPFAASFSEWLTSEGDLLTVEVPERPKPRRSRPGSRSDSGRSAAGT